MKKKVRILLLSILGFMILLLVQVFYRGPQQTSPNQSEKGEEQQNGTLYNVWIEKGEEHQITIFTEGKSILYRTKHKLSENIEKVVGDIELEDGIVTKVSIKPDKITGKVLVGDENYIELEGRGKVELDKNYKVYRVYGGIASEMLSSVVVGYSNAEFVVADGKICAALLTKPVEPKNIRVLITRDGTSGKFHNKVSLKSVGGLKVSCNGQEKTYKENEEVTIDTGNSWLKEGRLIITPIKKNEKITVTSIKRNNDNPSYRGTIEIANLEDGMVVVNEVSLEEYLYAVIPSEMPTSYGVEALKVQAVCARSYAYTQLLENSCRAYSAHMDDTVSYQVYNNVPENETSIQAVNDTKDMVLKYNNKVITAYYFSTSCGYTSSIEDVWNMKEGKEYLIGKLQNSTEKTMDLTTDENFKKFLNNKELITYDSSFPWYRWSVTIDAADIQKLLDLKLEDRYENNPEQILTKDKKTGKYISIPVGTVGKVKDIKVIERKTGGIVTGIRVIGSKQTVEIYSEYNIRILLGPVWDTITRQDNSTVDGMSLLPSAFFVIDKNKREDEITFKIQGGGYGHGVGMSQNGVKSMTLAGKTFEEILEHYYPGVRLSLAQE